MHNHGTLVISLDFELNWGVHDVLSLEQYKENLLGVRQAVPEMLKLFTEYDIHATWATVGLLFFGTKEKLENNTPFIKPSYINKKLSAYEKMHLVGLNEQDDPFHFASSLIKQIAATPNQEIATHTFSHYYCLEDGQRIEEFSADLEMAVKVASEQGYSIKSIAFPRNQTNAQYLEICKQFGLVTYRGNEISSIYQASSHRENQSSLKRMLRLADAYVNLTGDHIYSASSLSTEPIINIPSSRFLRPYSKRLKLLEPLRLQRIKNSLTKAARERKIYQLWWHPHNFGKDLKENLSFLREIFDHYLVLKEKYGMESLGTGEIGERIILKGPFRE